MKNKEANTPHTFKFKQFSLTDYGCAMKIGTDGVLLGAYSAGFASETRPEKVLDVGTGCGLIALMVAQKSESRIIGIDIDEKAVSVAEENFTHNKWRERLEIQKTSIQEFAKSTHHCFDMVVCNPPFFKNSLKSPVKSRNHARHADSLPLVELFESAYSVLNYKGNLIIIYTATDIDQISETATQKGFGCNEKLFISDTATSKPVRVIMHFVKSAPRLTSGISTPRIRFMTIKDEQKQQFSSEYRNLTQDFHPFF